MRWWSKAPPVRGCIRPCKVWKPKRTGFAAKSWRRSATPSSSIDGEEGASIYLNAAAERLYGIAASRALGRTLSTIYESRWINPNDEAAAAAALEQRGEWRGESIHVRHDGQEMNVELGVTMLREIDGKPTGLLAVIRDVSERKQHEDKVLVSEIRYRRLFETAHDGVLLLDPDTRKIIDANPFMTKMLGYSHDHLVGRELFEIGLLRDETASQEMFRKLSQTNQVRYENLPLRSQAGRHQDVGSRRQLLYQENGRRVIQCNIRDVTERKRSEDHVKLLMAEVNHRAKNLLAVVQAVAYQTARARRPGDPARTPGPSASVGSPPARTCWSRTSGRASRWPTSSRPSLPISGI